MNISSYPFTELYIVHGDMAMETPNTRSRRKREMDDSQEDGASITWMHDQALRKALLMATEHGQTLQNLHKK